MIERIIDEIIEAYGGVIDAEERYVEIEGEEFVCFFITILENYDVVDGRGELPDDYVLRWRYVELRGLLSDGESPAYTEEKIKEHFEVL